MPRLVDSASRLASQERAEPSRFFELVRWASRAELGSLHERAAASRAELGSFPPLSTTAAPMVRAHAVKPRSFSPRPTHDTPTSPER
jgi:hypothetical protein